MQRNSEIVVAGIPFATWVQVVTTIATVVGAFSVLHSQVEVAAQNLQELKQEVRELKLRELENGKSFSTIPGELKYLEHRVTDLEAHRPSFQK